MSLQMPRNYNPPPQGPFLNIWSLVLIVIVTIIFLVLFGMAGLIITLLAFLILDDLLPKGQNSSKLFSRP